MRYDFNEAKDGIPIRIRDNYSLLNENPCTNHVEDSDTLYLRTPFTDDEPVVSKGSSIGNSSVDRHSCSCRRQMTKKAFRWKFRGK